MTTIGTRERLIRAAEKELIRSHGHLEMQAVSKRAQVSVGLAYHHFGSKAGLIAAVVEAFYGRLDEMVFKEAQSASAKSASAKSSSVKSSSNRSRAEGWADREKRRIASYVAFHYDHPFAPLVIGALSRAPEVLDVETAFTNRQLAAGARMLQAAQGDGIVPDRINPHLTIALMIGGIRQALIGALMSQQRPDPEKLTDEIWAFMAAALRLPSRAFSSEVDTGSREENASNKEKEPPFRFNRNGKGSTSGVEKAAVTRPPDVQPSSAKHRQTKHRQR
jgi:AcrR family transcriptional regulator